jgi:adenylate cyclase
MKLLILIPWMLASQLLSAQFSFTRMQADSLWAIWIDPTQPDTSRVKALDDYAYYGYIMSHPDSTYYFAQMEYDFAERKGLKRQMGLALITQVDSWKARDDYAKVLDYQLRVMRHAEKIGDKEMLAESIVELGNFYAERGDYPHALDYYTRNLKMQEETGNQPGIAGMLNNIGIIYNRQKDFTRALDFFQRSFKMQEELGDQRSVAGTLINMGIIYTSLKDTIKAIEHYERGLKICEETGLDLFLSNALSGLAGIYSGQGDYGKAMDYFQRSLKIQQQIKAKVPMSGTLTNIGKLYSEKQEYKTSIAWCKKGLALATEIGAINQQLQACDCLYDAYKSLGQDNEALVFLEKKDELEQQLNKDETTRKLQQMEFAKVMQQDSIAYAAETRKVQEAHLDEVRKKNRTRNVLLGSAFLLLLLAGGLFLRWRKVSKSRDIISKEKDRSEHLLLNILPAEIAEELKEKGRSEARDFEMVSILFSDFKGFTETSSTLSAQDLIAEINSCFEVFDRIMEKYGIEKIKTIGDAYMAAGGLPVPTDDSVKQTVLAALEMQAFITERKARMDAERRPAFEMRVGIHTGPVVAGIVGVKRFQYDIWGDTVNTASRMESAGDIGKVNISVATYESIKHHPGFSFTYRGKVDAKGKGAVDMWFVDHSPSSASHPG